MSAPNRLLLSQAVEDEYREVIFRPKFDRFVAVERRQRILDIAVVAAERLEPTETVRECRDPKDDKYLALAAAGPASVIVSSDVRHLLSMHPWRGIPILLGGLSRAALNVVTKIRLVPFRGAPRRPPLIGCRKASRQCPPARQNDTAPCRRRARLAFYSRKRERLRLSPGRSAAAAHPSEPPRIVVRGRGHPAAVDAAAPSNLLAFASVPAGACRVYCAAVAMLAIPARRTVPPWSFAIVAALSNSARPSSFRAQAVGTLRPGGAQGCLLRRGLPVPES